MLVLSPLTRVLALALSSACAGAALGEQQKPVAGGAPFAPPTIETLSFSGSGCPQDGAGRKLVSGGWQHFAVTLPDFAAAIGGGAGVAARSASCQAHARLGAAAPGWQVALRDVWTAGRAELRGPGVRLAQFVTTYFSEDAARTVSASQTVAETAVDGAPAAVAEDVQVHARIPADSLVWSPCTGPDGYVGLVNVNFRVAFTSANKAASGYFGASKNATVSERWGWTWRRC
ncbi:hypothetical protein GGS23DRAFT_610153 [Durotheca rogersii]|uniref:uncharacterized protein n=1 Tax=Durotheca rogersii TaxID=419775 RepID=UPI00221F5DA3|nr:uncharacterized protein GGS23DRAFT_610153 [Durotheca rogersii]KAI5862497.1 hypothetical protein GGS23DRAFT_610153 [Durotheca rogersii]